MRYFEVTLYRRQSRWWFRVGNRPSDWTDAPIGTRARAIALIGNGWRWTLCRWGWEKLDAKSARYFGRIVEAA